MAYLPFIIIHLNILFYRFIDSAETQDEKKETTLKKKKKKSAKNIFKVEEVLPKKMNKLQNKNGTNTKQTESKNHNIKNSEKNHSDLSQNGNEIVEDVKKVKILPIDGHTEKEKKIIKHVKNDVKHKIDLNKKKIIKNVEISEKRQMDHSQNKNKNVNNGEKRKNDYTQNKLSKKRKFSDKNYKSVKEPSALESISDDRLKAYGINPKKFRNKLKFGNN